MQAIEKTRMKLIQRIGEDIWCHDDIVLL